MSTHREITDVRVCRVSFGRGVFAERCFRRGETVGAVTGRVRDDEAYSSDYCIDLGGSLTLEPRAPFRYLNHSCEPNCRLYVLALEETEGKHPVPRVVLVALRAIEAEAELTIDYAWSADSAVPCLCGTPRCRGWIVAATEVAALKRRVRRGVPQSERRSRS